MVVLALSYKHSNIYVYMYMEYAECAERVAFQAPLEMPKWARARNL